MKLSSTEIGKKAEQKALIFLEKRGLKILEKNYRSALGEIDLIMQDKDTTVFIEVRSRKNNSKLDAIETIDQRKTKKIIQTSQQYLQNAKKSTSLYYRFDVISIHGDIEDKNIEWIKNAFDA